jgi:hypothetical protein
MHAGRQLNIWETRFSLFAAEDMTFGQMQLGVIQKYTLRLVARTPPLRAHAQCMPDFNGISSSWR